ncbi:MAG TPA: pitrilysin family protein [Pyrinomonadaceae bacterium]
MTSRPLVLKFAVIALVLTTVTPILAQTSRGPRQEKLLNGLKLLMWQDANADRVSVKIRIHSGTSFDPQGKEGVMALLADSFYANETSADFFKEDLGGGLSVTANYDYIQVTGWAKPDEFLTLLESLSAAVSNPTLDKETTPKLVARRLEKLKELEADPVYVADRAASKQLFGTFPYGRPELGTPESVTGLTFADVIDVKQRFLSSDNATVSISGKIDPALAYRAARRYLGSWLKSDRLVPSTFQQPETPDTKLVKVSTETETVPHTRFALRGVARNEKDYPAAKVLENILEARVKQNLSDASLVYVLNEAHILPGSFVIGATSADEIPGNLISLLLSKAITGAEFDSARAKAIADRQKQAADELWLDADTYKLKSAADEQKSFVSVTLADVQRVAERLAKNPVVAVTVTKAEKAPTAN